MALNSSLFSALPLFCIGLIRMNFFSIDVTTKTELPQMMCRKEQDVINSNRKHFDSIRDGVFNIMFIMVHVEILRFQ